MSQKQDFEPPPPYFPVKPFLVSMLSSVSRRLLLVEDGMPGRLAEALERRLEAGPRVTVVLASLLSQEVS